MNSTVSGAVVKDVATFNTSKGSSILTVNATVAGQSLRFKMWGDNPLASGIGEGVILPDFSVEPKEKDGKREIWAVPPPRGGGGRGGGGVARSDPAKNATIAAANTRNNDTMHEASVRKAASELTVVMVNYNIAVIQANVAAGVQKEKESKLSIEELRNTFADCLDIVKDVNA